MIEYPDFTSLKSSTSREPKYLNIYPKIEKKKCHEIIPTFISSRTTASRITLLLALFVLVLSNSNKNRYNVISTKKNKLQKEQVEVAVSSLQEVKTPDSIFSSHVTNLLIFLTQKITQCRMTQELHREITESSSIKIVQNR